MMGKSFHETFSLFWRNFRLLVECKLDILTVLLEKFAHVTYETSLGDIAFKKGFKKPVFSTMTDFLAIQNWQIL